MERNRRKNKISRWWIFPTNYTHTRWIPYIHKAFTGSSLLNINNENVYKNVSVFQNCKMISVPMSATKSTAILGCPSGFSRSLPDELTSCWYNNYMYYINLNVLGRGCLG